MCYSMLMKFNSLKESVLIIQINNASSKEAIYCYLMIPNTLIEQFF